MVGVCWFDILHRTIWSLRSWMAQAEIADIHLYKKSTTSWRIWRRLKTRHAAGKWYVGTSTTTHDYFLCPAKANGNTWCWVCAAFAIVAAIFWWCHGGANFVLLVQDRFASVNMNKISFENFSNSNCHWNALVYTKQDDWNCFWSIKMFRCVANVISNFSW